MIENGREALTDAFRREGLPVQRMWTPTSSKSVIGDLSYADLDALLAAIGEHHVSARSVAQRVAAGLARRRATTRAAPGHGACGRGGTAPRPTTSACTSRASTTCSCASRPAARRCPATTSIGFITRGRGVSVHRADCANAVSLGQEQSSRMIEVDWEGERHSAVYRAGVEVVALDRSRLLRDVANALSDHRVNIVAVRHDDRQRPGGQDALRVRARRPRPPRRGDPHDQVDRRRLRRLPPRAGGQRVGAVTSAAEVSTHWPNDASSGLPGRRGDRRLA